MNRLPVPSELHPPRKESPYPPHQVGPRIEDAFLEYHVRNEASFPPEPIYLPVGWTAYYRNHDHARRKLRELQQWLDEVLEPGLRYYTLVEHDEGIANVLPESVVVFGAGGVGDIPIPLLCDPHPRRDVPRDVFASFIGSPTHPSRRRLRALAERRDDFAILAAPNLADGLETFRELLARSVFSLCPRGHGRTSFRLYEALQTGSIPVYLYDEPWLPYADELNWRRFAVLAHVSEIPWLPEILDGISQAEIAAMQRAGLEMVSRYFTLDAVIGWIQRRVQRIHERGFTREWVGRSVNESRLVSVWAGANARDLRGEP